MLGLGLSFMLEGIKMMGDRPVVAAIAMAGTFILLSREKIPAMLILLAFGVSVALISNPALWSELATISVRLRIPEFYLGTANGPSRPPTSGRWSRATPRSGTSAFGANRG